MHGLPPVLSAWEPIADLQDNVLRGTCRCHSLLYHPFPEYLCGQAVQPEREGSYHLHVIGIRTVAVFKKDIAVRVAFRQYPAFVNNLRTALAAYGYTCKVFPTFGHQDEERQILQFLLKNPLRAILAEPVKSALPTLNTELYQMLLQKGTAVFFLGCAYPGLSQVPVLSGNPDYGASLLVQDLAAKGHTCIAGIFQIDDLRGHQHCQGFLNAMENQGLLVPDRNLGWFTTEDLDDFRQNRDIRFLQKFLEKLTADCTAIVCEDDFIAWLLWEKLSLSSSAPFMETQPSGSISQLALSAFNTSYLTASGLLRAATLTSPTHEPAQMAARMIADKLKGLPVSSQEVPLQLLPPK